MPSPPQIPTLPSLYAAARLTPVPRPLFPPSPSINAKISLHQGSIVSVSTAAIVNAANTSLLGGGGVDGAIHSAAGPGLQRECAALHGCPTGSAKITGAHNLPCQKVIHAVGPNYHRLGHAEAEEALRGCYRRSLELAAENACRSVAFSAISTGIYGYPAAEAAKVALGTTREFLGGPDGAKLDRVVFVLFESKDVEAYRDAVPLFFPPAETQ
ncbi:related to hismacro and SEC14 domain-containing proteins [Cephalotrichum gorgonifer]|uniref:Related to hismacro and SEC14 domain-containing proteins n=1 Tax=Cephalotrichum gorgonifer TaxID=2041049 RepID=A0AAE8MXI1_9PEZI|nr:related to hismacro and SEC14 domain-containing proteins [Cephalotrichum gorgonifer]